MRFILLLFSALTLLAQNPETAVFPGGTATDTNLLVAHDNSQTTLATTMNDSVQTVVLASAANFTAPVVITIDNEQILCTAKMTNTLSTCTRGFAGTAQAGHTSGVPVYGFLTAKHHNQLAAEVKALEARSPQRLCTGTQYTGADNACHDASAGGASTTLNNLGTTSINAHLLPQTSLDLGSTTAQFRDLFLYGAGTFSSTYLRLTGTPTGARVLTLPNATDTLVGKATTDTFTNKTFDTAGTGNSFKINGTAVSAVSGTGAVCLASGSACAAAGGNPGGSDTMFQFNDGGGSTFGGTVGMTWDKAHPGIGLSGVNPTQGNDGEARIARFTITYGDTVSAPNFSDQNGVEIFQTALMGQNVYGTGTNAKKTFIPLYVTNTNYAAGQRFTYNFSQTCYGMGDCALHGNNSVYFAGADISGDEGQGFGLVSMISQQPQLATTTISTVPTRNTCNATLTEDITASQTPQTISVNSSTGCAGWVVLGHAAPSGSPNVEAVLVTVPDGTHITGVFLSNHTATTGGGQAVLPATVFNVTNVGQFGQDRVLVNLSATPYTTGTVASISGGGFTGSGTTWTDNMVGGSATNPGCISLTNDNITLPSTEVMRAWYEINVVTSNTLLGIMTTSVAGDTSYRGNGVGDGAYVIRPCARVLFLVSSAGNLTGQIVLDTNSFTWTNGNSIELAISPYPDVTLHNEAIQLFSPGGTYREWYQVRNVGQQPLQNGLVFGYAGAYNPSTMGPPVKTGISFQSVGTGIYLAEVFTNAMQVIATNRNATTKTPSISWIGGLLGVDFFGDYDTGSWVVTTNSKTVATTSPSFALRPNVTANNYGTAEIVGNLTLKQYANQGTPDLTLRTISDNSVILSATGMNGNRRFGFPDADGTILAATGNSTTGSGTQTFTNSPCSTLTTAQWIPVRVPGQANIWYVPACQ